METNYNNKPAWLPIFENSFKTDTPITEEETVMKGFLQKFLPKTPAPKDLAEKIRYDIKTSLI